MQVRVERVSRLHYARVIRVAMSSGDGEIELEVPEKVLREAGLSLKEGDALELEVAKERGELDNWDLVMTGEVYLKLSNPPRVYASLGGLQLVLKRENSYEEFRVGDKVYVKVRRMGGG